MALKLTLRELASGAKSKRFFVFVSAEDIGLVAQLS